MPLKMAASHALDRCKKRVWNAAAIIRFKSTQKLEK
jgi:hypothetical protein